MYLYSLLPLGDKAIAGSASPHVCDCMKTAQWTEQHIGMQLISLFSSRDSSASLGMPFGDVKSS